jgi:hypothetical protein
VSRGEGQVLVVVRAEVRPFGARIRLPAMPVQARAVAADEAAARS